MFKEFTPILHKLFWKTDEEETVPNLFDEASITLPQTKDTTKKELQTNIIHEHGLENPCIYILYTFT